MLYPWGMNAKNTSEKLLEFFGTQLKLSEVANVSQPYVSRVLKGDAEFGPAACVAIEKSSHGAFTRKDLRPNDWQDIWPELATSPPE